jgi:flagellar motor switch protein FliN/FliY
MAEDEIPASEGTQAGEDDMAATMAEIAAQEAANQAAESDRNGDATDTAAEDDDEPRESSDLAAVYDVPVQVSAVLGKANMQVSQLLKLGRGAVVELDRKVGEAIDIYVNNRLVARGEVVIVDERLGVTMTEIVKAD